jgi:hypothetical protein
VDGALVGAWFTVAHYLYSLDSVKCYSLTLNFNRWYQGGFFSSNFVMQLKWPSFIKNDLARFGYILDMIVQKNQNPSIFLATCRNSSQKSGNLGKKNSSKSGKFAAFVIWLCQTDSHAGKGFYSKTSSIE